ncbi:hypothetical protein KR009_005718 [Drosophila setifemur]|nr:hypothetical protein KR009_005718 [Drosophila setifemur]
MDYLDIESFRSKYSDITLTAVPNRTRKPEERPIEPEARMATKEQEPRVEITRVTPGGAAPAAPSSSQAMMLRNKVQVQNAAALAYASEYKEVMAKLEYTKYMQAQLQLMTLANGAGGGVAAGLEGCLYGMMPSAISLDVNANIVDKYSDLLNLLSKMQPNIPPTIVGLRAPKERLQRDIAQARVMVRECLLILERDQEKADDPQSHSMDTPTSE